MSAKAENIDEAYELINYSFTPEVGGQTVNEIGYNSAVNGASDHYSDETKALAKAIYPGDTSTKLNPWPQNRHGMLMQELNTLTNLKQRN